MKPGLTILTVSFHSQEYIRLNVLLAKRMNPGVTPRWIVVDNSSDFSLEPKLPGVTLLPGIPPFLIFDRGSFHHALGIHAGLREVDTRYLLVLDPDFFILRPNWIKALTSHMEGCGLSFFGSCWHPRWTANYRYFPAVHCMLIDLERVGNDSLDFKPNIAGGRFWNTVVCAPGLSPRLRRLLNVGMHQDTGWKIFDRFASDSAHKSETLVPHFKAPASDRSSWIPDRFSLTPKRPGYFTDQSYLLRRFPAAYRSGWEEFFWRDEFFGFHLKNIGREVDKTCDLRQLVEILQFASGEQAASETRKAVGKVCSAGGEVESVS